jgi:hypothetical protein
MPGNVVILMLALLRSCRRCHDRAALAGLGFHHRQAVGSARQAGIAGPRQVIMIAIMVRV